MFLSRLKAVLLLLAAAVPAYPASIQVEIDGISAEELHNVRLFLDIVKEKDANGLSDDTVRRLHDQAPAQIKSALRPFGYYQPTVTGTLRRGAEIPWVARYEVDTGPAMQITAVDVQIIGEGRTDPRLIHQVKGFPLHKGDILNHGLYEMGKQNIQRIAYLNGYFDSRFLVKEMRVDPQQFNAEIHLHFDTGMRYRFGPVHFKQSTYDEKYLRRFMPFKEGEPFVEEKLAELQFRLQDSDNFQIIDVERRRDLAKDYEIPLDLNLEPAMKHRFQFGLGASTDEGPRGLARWRNRRVNQSGHTMGAQVKATQIGAELSAYYSIPLQKPNSDHLEFITTAKKLDPKPDADKTIKHSLTKELITRRTLQRFNKWSETVSLRLLTEDFETKTSEGIKTRDEKTLLIPGASWSKLDTDDIIFPRRGYRLFTNIEGADREIIGTDVDYFSLRLQGKWMRSLGPNVFILRSDFGFLATNDLIQLPTTLRFYAGGDNSVRGFGYESIGSNNAAEKAQVTQQQLQIYSGEYQLWLLHSWGVTVFTDAGSITTDAETQIPKDRIEFRTAERFKKGAGFGLLWRSPVGPFSLSIARQYDATKEESKPEIKLHLSIGPNL